MSEQATAAVPHAIKELALAENGKRRIEWAFQAMPVLATIRKDFIKTQRFADVRIAALLPMTPEAANLVITLRDGGAKVAVCGAYPEAIEDDIAASLVRDYALPVFAVRHATAEESAAHITKALSEPPQIVLDQTGALTAACIQDNGGLRDGAKPLLGSIIQANEGTRKLRALAQEGGLHFPILAGSRSLTRRVFYSRVGLGQSMLDAVTKSLNVLIAGLTVVVAGFGSTGRGIAGRAQALGANVVITEVDPVRALEAAMAGYRVMSMADAASIGDLFFTASGNRSVISREHFDKLRNGAILANGGVADAEIDAGTLGQIASGRRPFRPDVEEISMRDGRRVYLLARGKALQGVMANVPSSVLDLSFANLALSAEYLLKNREQLRAEVYRVPVEIDRQVARLKLEAMGAKIDRLTVEQEQYLAGLAEE